MLNLRRYRNDDATGVTVDDRSANNHSEIKFAQNRWLELLDTNKGKSQLDEEEEIDVDNGRHFAEAEPMM